MYILVNEEDGSVCTNVPGMENGAGNVPLTQVDRTVSRQEKLFCTGQIFYLMIDEAARERFPTPVHYMNEENERKSFSDRPGRR